MSDSRLGHQLLHACNARDDSGLAVLIHPRAECTSVPMDFTFRGPSSYYDLWSVLIRAFPDLEVKAVMAAGGDEAAAFELTLQGTHLGTLELQAGSLAATGREILVEGCEVQQYCGGQLESARLYFDLSTVLRQLGFAAAV